MALAVLLRSGCKSQGVSMLVRSASLSPELSRTFGTPSKCLAVAVTAQPKATTRTISTTPVKLSDAAAHGGNHVALWTAERGLSLALLGVVPVAIAFPSQAGDAALALSIVMHQHWGLEAIVTDYIRPIIFGDTIPKISHGLLLLFSAATLGGLFYFIYNDIGIANAVRKFWAVKSKQ